jgi:hypothetical protein
MAGTETKREPAAAGAQLNGPPPVAKSKTNTVWIYEKEDDDQGKRYRVDPSPKAVEATEILFFQNLTDETATINALNVLEDLHPDPLVLPAGATGWARVKALATGKYRYKVKVNGTPAHGKSDPDLIVP